MQVSRLKILVGARLLMFRLVCTVSEPYEGVGYTRLLSGISQIETSNMLAQYWISAAESRNPC